MKSSEKKSPRLVSLIVRASGPVGAAFTLAENLLSPQPAPVLRTPSRRVA